MQLCAAGVVTSGCHYGAYLTHTVGQGRGDDGAALEVVSG
ncbi:Unknown protein sequence [Pseudomonas savastanoi pv. phaseolicola]|nr:Unknown protein sequence [Pseudomonas savastanoi pv. phaseolicola]RMV63675.1 hypothetical protein ALP07_102823 [Pseudomonas savastanoi pv. glycinea]